MNIINCTPHPVVVVPAGDGPNRVFQPSGICPRVAEKPLNWIIVDDVQTVLINDLDIRVTGLPGRKSNTMYLVSRMVFDAADDRDDLAVPYDFVRDDDGKIVGCRHFLVRTPADAEANRERHAYASYKAYEAYEAVRNEG